MVCICWCLVLLIVRVVFWFVGRFFERLVSGGRFLGCLFGYFGNLGVFVGFVLVLVGVRWLG